MLKTLEIEFIDNWDKVIKRAWSVRFMVLGLALAALSVVLPLMAPAIPVEQLIWPYGVITFFVIFAAGLCSRLVKQDGLAGDQ